MEKFCSKKWEEGLSCASSSFVNTEELDHLKSGNIRTKEYSLQKVCSKTPKTLLLWAKGKKPRHFFGFFSAKERGESATKRFRRKFEKFRRRIFLLFPFCSRPHAHSRKKKENLVESTKKKAEKTSWKKGSAAAINIISLPFQTSYFFPSGFMWESHALTSFFGFLLPLPLGSNGTRMGETETSGGPNIPFPSSFIFSFRSQDDCVEKFRGNGGGWILFNIPQPQP